MTSEQNKNPDMAEKSNAEKWVLYLSAFDFSALRIGLAPSIDSQKRPITSLLRNTLLPSSALAERTNYAIPHPHACCPANPPLDCDQSTS